MNLHTRFTLVSASAAGMLLATLGVAAPPAWPRIQGGALGSGQASVVGPQQGIIKWTIPIRGWAGSAAVDGDGIIYFCSSTLGFFALHPNGTTKWRYQLPPTSPPADLRPGEQAEWVEQKQGGSTATHSPAIGSDGTVYFGLSFHPNDAPEDAKLGLYALSPAGALKWIFPSDGSVTSSPNITPAGDLVFTTVKTLYCTTREGKLKWQFERGAGGVKWCSPAVDATGCVYVVGDALYCLKPDGKVRWRYAPASGPLKGFAGHPAIAEDGSIYIAAGSKLYAVSTSGSELWTKEIGWTESAPGVGRNGLVYIGTGRTEGSTARFLAVNAKTGEIEWEFPIKNAVDSSPVIGLDGLVYLGTDDGLFYAFTPQGAVKWKLDIGTTPGRLGEIDTAAAFGSDGTLYFGHHGGHGDNRGRLCFYAIAPE